MPNNSFVVRYGRPLIILGTALFAVSLAFPLLASLLPDNARPSWIGVLDVTLVLILAGVMIGIETAARGQVDTQAQQTSYRGYRIVLHLPIVLLILFFIAGEQIQWGILLPGLAWRTWLGLYILPAGVAVWRMSTPMEDKH